MFSLGVKYFFSSIQRSRLKNVLRLTIISLSINIAAFVVAISLMRGFQTEVMQKLLHIHGHARIYPAINIPKAERSNDNTILQKIPVFARSYFSKVLDSIEIHPPSLKRVIKKSQAQAIIKHISSNPVAITGMNEDDTNYVIGKNLKSGKISFQKIGDFWPIIIGSRLAKQINAAVDTEVQLISSNLITGEMMNIPCKVKGIFDFGFHEFDNGMIFVPNSLVDKYFPESKAIGVIYIDQPDKIDEYLPTVFRMNEEVEAQSWKEIYRSIQEMFNTHALGISLLMGMFIISGVVQSISSLSILMSDRAYDISVLTMMGMSKMQKYKIFISYGILISIVNVFFGMTAGIGLSLAYPYLRDAFEDFTSIKIVDPNAFWISTFNTKLLIQDLLKIGIGSLFVMIIGMLVGTYFVLKTEDSEGIKD